jgi:hypothetical protein
MMLRCMISKSRRDTQSGTLFSDADWLLKQHFIYYTVAQFEYPKYAQLYDSHHPFSITTPLDFCWGSIAVLGVDIRITLHYVPHRATKDGTSILVSYSNLMLQSVVESSPLKTDTRKTRNRGSLPG